MDIRHRPFNPLRRGVLWALGPALALWLLAAVLLLVLVCCAGPEVSDPPGPRRPSSPPPASPSSTPPDPVNVLLDRAWSDQRLGCALPTTLITDGLAAVLEARLELPHLDAVIVAARYRDDRCPVHG